MEITLPKTSAVLVALLRADFTTLWRNRRSVIMALVLPVIIVLSWKNLIRSVGGIFVLSNGVTLGLVAVGLMGYANSIARDRDKGVFQRLRVSPLPLWTIMASRLLVQLAMIMLITLVVFFAGHNCDQITLSAAGYAVTFLIAILGGALYLSLGQVIVGRVQNPESVNSTARLVYFSFIMSGTFGELGALGENFKNFIRWTPYGTVNTILAAGMEPANWNNQASIALVITFAYIITFVTLGVRWFKWDSR